MDLIIIMSHKHLLFYSVYTHLNAHKKIYYDCQLAFRFVLCSITLEISYNF